LKICTIYKGLLRVEVRFQKRGSKISVKQGFQIFLKSYKFIKREGVFCENEKVHEVRFQKRGSKISVKQGFQIFLKSYKFIKREGVFCENEKVYMD